MKMYSSKPVLLGTLAMALVVGLSAGAMSAFAGGGCADGVCALPTAGEAAAKEMKAAPEYMHRVVNDDLDKAFNELKSIIVAEHGRASSAKA